MYKEIFAFRRWAKEEASTSCQVICEASTSSGTYRQEVLPGEAQEAHLSVI